MAWQSPRPFRPSRRVSHVQVGHPVPGRRSAGRPAVPAGHMVKYATALRLGTAESESILRRFTPGGPKHPPTRRWKNLAARCARSSPASPELRRIHGGLQVVENWNSGHTALFYGIDGGLTGPDREHAEVSMQHPPRPPDPVSLTDRRADAQAGQSQSSDPSTGWALLSASGGGKLLRSVKACGVGPWSRR